MYFTAHSSSNLAVDCCGSVNEIIAPSNLDDGDRYLRWGDIELFAFRPGGKVSLKARVDYIGLKGSTPSNIKSKSIPLWLLPLSLTAQVGLRQPVTLGFIEKAFESISGWSDIQTLRPGPDGSRIFIKEDDLSKPVSHL